MWSLNRPSNTITVSKASEPLIITVMAAGPGSETGTIPRHRRARQRRLRENATELTVDQQHHPVRTEQKAPPTPPAGAGSLAGARERVAFAPDPVDRRLDRAVQQLDDQDQQHGT